MEAEKHDFIAEKQAIKFKKQYPKGCEFSFTQGYNNADRHSRSEISDLESRLGKALDDFAEVVKERDRLKEEIELIKNHSPLKI